LAKGRVDTFAGSTDEGLEVGVESRETVPAGGLRVDVSGLAEKSFQA